MMMCVSKAEHGQEVRKPHEFKAGGNCPFCEGKLTTPTQCNREECWFNKVDFH